MRKNFNKDGKTNRQNDR
jgi:hypothetical protein